jgi:hypothetical protein
LALKTDKLQVANRQNPAAGFNLTLPAPYLTEKDASPNA